MKTAGRVGDGCLFSVLCFLGGLGFTLEAVRPSPMIQENEEKGENTRFGADQFSGFSVLPEWSRNDHEVARGCLRSEGRGSLALSTFSRVGCERRCTESPRPSPYEGDGGYNFRSERTPEASPGHGVYASAYGAKTAA